MGMEKWKRRLVSGGTITSGAITSSGAVTGTSFVFGSSTISESGAGTVVVTAASRVDLSRGTAQLLINNGTAALGTADFAALNGAIALRTVSGTPAIGFRVNGTVYYALRDGNL